MKIWRYAKFSLTLHPHSGRWCNGNTTGFGSVIPGSNPSRPTITPEESLLILLIISRVVGDAGGRKVAANWEKGGRFLGERWQVSRRKV